MFVEDIPPAVFVKARQIIARRDIRRISRLHGTFISFPGKDHFCFQILENERGYMIEFPNDSTHMCGELMDQIKNTVGEENIRLEPILYQ